MTWLDRLRRMLPFLLLLVAPTQTALVIPPAIHVCVADPLVWLAFGWWAWRVARRRENWRAAVPPWPAFAFIGWAALSAARSGSLPAAAKEAVQYAEYALAAVVVFSSALSDPARRRPAASFFLAVSGAVALVGLVHYLSPSLADFRVRATFGNRNVLGGFLTLCAPLGLAVALFDRGPARRAAGAALCGAAFLVNLAGGAALGTALACGWLAALKSRRALALALAAGLALALVAAPRLPRHRDATMIESLRLYDEDGEPEPRYPEWQAAVEAVRDQPWLGVGAGQYQAHIGMYFGVTPRSPRPVEADTQNLYLVLAVSLGLPGLAAYLALLASAAAAATRRGLAAPDPAERALSLGAAAAVLAFAVASVWSPLLVRGIGIPLAFVLSLAWTAARGATTTVRSEERNHT